MSRILQKALPAGLFMPRLAGLRQQEAYNKKAATKT